MDFSGKCAILSCITAYFLLSFSLEAVDVAFSSELCAVEPCEILRFNCFILGYHRLTPFFLKRLLNIILYKSDESNYTLTPAINVFCIILRSADNNV